FRYISGLLITFRKVIQFQEIVWFISQELPAQHTERMDEFVRVVREGYGITQYVISNNSQIRMVRSGGGRNHVSFIFTTGKADPIMGVVNKVLTSRHYYFAVFMLMDKIGSDMEPAYDICRYLYNYQFENSLLYFESEDGTNNLFGASRYPVMKIENRSDLARFFRKKRQQSLNAHMDVEGFSFPTPLRQDPPHLFKVRDRYEGSTYRIIETFVQHLNGSFNELQQPPDALGGQMVNMKETLELVRQRRIEFSAHAYALFTQSDEIEKSYPLLVVRWCLMVPLYNSVSTYFYAVQPFDTLVWFFVVGAFLGLALVELLWLWLLPDGATVPVPLALLNTFCYIINIATGRQLVQPSTLRVLLLFAVFFHGFFLSANYTSTLGSILTVNLFHAQLNTMEDLLQAQLPVMIIDYELEFLLQLHQDLPEEFQALLRPVDSGIYAQHQIGLNSSFAYFVTEDNWQFLDQQQRHLKQRRFKFSDICFGSFHLAYPMQTDSSLWRDLEYYTFRVHSSGLHNYYARISFESALHAGLVQRLQENKDFIGAGLQHLAIAFIFLLTMTALAAIIFALEVFWV
ncbi:hypothetical protein KR222_004508, partial [Zaprionus bogoriensis]